MNTDQILTTLKQSGKLDVIKSIIDEALTEEKKDWNRRCAPNTEYYYAWDGTEWMTYYDRGAPNNYMHYSTGNYFPRLEYTQEQLTADGVHRMGLTERWAYKFAKGNGYPWLTEEERLDGNTTGYYVYYSVQTKRFIAFKSIFGTNYAYGERWFAEYEHAQLFCDWANTHLKPNGELK